MKLLILALLSANVMAATEVRTVTICKNGACEQKTVTESHEVPNIDVKTINIGDCLLDPKTDKVILVEGNDLRTKKLSYLVQDNAGDINSGMVLLRTYVFTDSRQFNPKMIKTACTGTLFEQDYVRECLSKNGKTTHKLFCVEPRKKAF